MDETDYCHTGKNRTAAEWLPRGRAVFIAWPVLSGRRCRLVLTGAVRWRATKKKDLQSDL